MLSMVLRWVAQHLRVVRPTVPARVNMYEWTHSYDVDGAAVDPQQVPMLPNQRHSDLFSP
jgi:hypothetical protein